MPKSLLFGDIDRDGPEIDVEAATRALVLHLYRTGRYEQWCLDYSKDKEGYWMQVFGTGYAEHRIAEPVDQMLIRPKKRGFLAVLGF